MTTPQPIPAWQRFLPAGAVSPKAKKILAVGAIAGVGIIALTMGGNNSPAIMQKQAAATKLEPPVSLREVQNWQTETKQNLDRLAEAKRQFEQQSQDTQIANDAQQQAALQDAARQRAAFNQAQGYQQQPQAVQQPKASAVGRIGFDVATATTAPVREERSAQQADLPSQSKDRNPLDFDPDWPTVILPEGTVIETVLTNRLDGSSDGPVECMLTTPLYYPGSHTVLLPQGARFIGESAAVNAFGQQRLAVKFHRIIVQGQRVYSIPLDGKMPGLDQEGATALHDKVNSHYASIFGASLAIGAIGGLANIGNSGIGYSAGGQFRAGISQGMSQSSERVLDRFLSRMPTITVREGTRVKILTTADLTMPIFKE